MELFNASEIFEFALKIEENGEIFYRKYAEKCEDQSLKSMFNFLADEEVRHKNTFQRLLSNIEKYEPFESYPDEYFLYLSAFVENTIFNQEKLSEEIEKIKDNIDAVDFAIRRELDSINYYNEIKLLVPKEERESIEHIIKEEKDHFLKLSQLKERLKKHNVSQ